MATDEPLDPRRWFAASVAIVSVAIPVLDNTILNLAMPTILREFHTAAPEPAMGDHRLLADVRDL